MSDPKLRYLADRSEWEHLTHKERMDQGYPYWPSDPEICQNRLRCRNLIREFNASQDAEQLTDLRKSILRKLLNPNSFDNVFIEPNFRCDYGYNITFGDGCFLNFDCCIMDNGPVTIGKNFMAGPACQIYTACHPLCPFERLEYEYTRPVTIGDNVWMGGGAMIMPGISIGNGVTIAGGSVVTKDVPDYVVVAGNPARIIKHLDQSKRKAEEMLKNETEAEKLQQ